MAKGAASLMGDIKTLLRSDPARMSVTKSIFEDWLISLDADGTMDGEEQNPLNLCFVMFFLA
jgi:hypothetical protein